MLPVPLTPLTQTPVQQALTLQKKRKATQKLQSPAKRIRPPQDSPLKKITRNESRQMQQQNQHISSQSGRFTLDCVLVDRASTLSTRGKRKEPQSISDREESPEIELLSHSPEIPLSPLPSEHDVAPTSEIGEQELILPSSDAAEEVSNRSVDILFGPPSKSVKTYGKRKVGRPRKSLG